MLLRIGTLSDRTGVSADVLRSWERRYGLFAPVRTAGGFRLYSDADLARVEAMRDLIESGLSAGDAARQLLESPAGGPQTTGFSPLAEARDGLEAAMRAFDERTLGAAIDRVLATTDLDTAIRDIYLPALRVLGDDWAAGRVTVAQEHFAVTVLRARFLALARDWDHGAGPRALLACPPGERHDTSLVLFGLALRRRGWRITFLGADTPFEDLDSAGLALKPDLTVLFSVDWDGRPDLAPALAARAGTLTLAGRTVTDVTLTTGCTWLTGDPVAAAEQVTVARRPPGARSRQASAR